MSIQSISVCALKQPQKVPNKHFVCVRIYALTRVAIECESNILLEDYLHTLDLVSLRCQPRMSVACGDRECVEFYLHQKKEERGEHEDAAVQSNQMCETENKLWSKLNIGLENLS